MTSKQTMPTQRLSGGLTRFLRKQGLTLEQALERGHARRSTARKPRAQFVLTASGNRKLQTSQYHQAARHAAVHGIGFAHGRMFIGNVDGSVVVV